jgi:6-phosphofructo-2-kinase/fructose-2,6-biphosphatase
MSNAVLLSKSPQDASVQRRATSSPPKHLEMASDASDGVLDASAVNCVRAEGTDRRRLAIVLVGLPARGKSYTANKLSRYLTWLGHSTRHVNVGSYRRQFVGGSCSADFFSAENAEAVASRTAVAKLAAEDMLSWLESRGGQVAIFDATNSTRARRKMLVELCSGRCSLIFLEMVSTDEALIRQNVLEKITSSPDYAGMDAEAAFEDFERRQEEYKKVYEPIIPPGASEPLAEESGYSFIRCVNTAQSGEGTLTLSRIQGYLPGRVVNFIVSSSLVTGRKVYLCRHGQSEDNVAARIGGDAALSKNGRGYAQSLRRFVDSLPPDARPSAVWTSTLRRTIQTAKPLSSSLPQVQWKALDEIDAGDADGLTYAEVSERMPGEAQDIGRISSLRKPSCSPLPPPAAAPPPAPPAPPAGRTAPACCRTAAAWASPAARQPGAAGGTGQPAAAARPPARAPP